MRSKFEFIPTPGIPQKNVKQFAFILKQYLEDYNMKQGTCYSFDDLFDLHSIIVDEDYLEQKRSRARYAIHYELSNIINRIKKIEQNPGWETSWTLFNSMESLKRYIKKADPIELLHGNDYFERTSLGTYVILDYKDHTVKNSLYYMAADKCNIIVYNNYDEPTSPSIDKETYDEFLDDVHVFIKYIDNNIAEIKKENAKREAEERERRRIRQKDTGYAYDIYADYLRGTSNPYTTSDPYNIHAIHDPYTRVVIDTPPMYPDEDHISLGYAIRRRRRGGYATDPLITNTS